MRNYIHETSLTENEKELSLFLAQVGTREQLQYQLKLQIEKQFAQESLITILHAALRVRRITHPNEEE